MNYSIRLLLRTAFPDKSCLPSVKSTISISRDPKFIVSVAEIKILVSHRYHLSYPPVLLLGSPRSWCFSPSSLINTCESKTTERTYNHSFSWPMASNPAPAQWSTRLFIVLFSGKKLVAGGIENPQSRENCRRTPISIPVSSSSITSDLHRVTSSILEGLTMSAILYQSSG